MPPMDRPKRMLVRSSLVAGSTVATLIGAQTLITIDQQNPALNNSAASSPAESTAAPTVQVVQPTATVVVHAAPVIQIVHVAPSISVVRQTGQSTRSSQAVAAQPTAVPQAVIQPPVPVQLAAPAPVIVQQSSGSGSGSSSNTMSMPAPRTHSSR